VSRDSEAVANSWKTGKIRSFKKNLFSLINNTVFT
jgi:hypothetical protein